MASIPVYDRSGAELKRIEVDPTEVAPRISRQLLHDVVVMYQANRRQGSHRTKSRAEVEGTTKKMYRQKGTGNARAGSRRSGIRRGGGHIFAKRPRDYSYRLPRKAVKLATRMAVASRIADDKVVLIDELSFSEPKTREMADVLKALKLDGQTVLVATDGYDVNAYKSIRNIPGVRVLPISDINAYEVLRPRRVLLTEAAWETFRGQLSQPAGAQPQTDNPSQPQADNSLSDQPATDESPAPEADNSLSDKPATDDQAS